MRSAQGAPRLVRDDPDHPELGFAELYARLPMANSAEPWLTWARQARGPCLYLGVGTGRLAIPLAAAGISIVGVDVHPGMLAVFNQRAPHSRAILAKIEDLQLRERFELVIAPSNILCTQRRLQGAARTLAARGRLAFELTNPHWLGQVFRRPSRRRGSVHVLSLTQDVSELEVDYELDDGGWFRQRAIVPLIWPEHIEPWLAQAALRLAWLGGTGSRELCESSTFRVVAMPRRG